MIGLAWTTPFFSLLTVRLLAVVNFEFEITNLSINIEPQASTAPELEHLARGTPVVAGTISDTCQLGIPVELAILNARHAIYGA